MDVEIVRKTKRDTLTERYSFPVKNEMKEKLDRLKYIHKIDINEMFRVYADRIIVAAEEKTA